MLKLGCVDAFKANTFTGNRQRIAIMNDDLTAQRLAAKALKPVHQERYPAQQQQGQHQIRQTHGPAAAFPRVSAASHLLKGLLIIHE